MFNIFSCFKIVNVYYSHCFNVNLLGFEVVPHLFVL